MDKNTKQYWRELALACGVSYSDLNSVYKDLRLIEQAQLDHEKEIRIAATKVLFPEYLSPDRWWVILHRRLENIVGDRDFTVIRNFDDKARILANEFATLDKGDPLLTTQHVFEYLISTPGHMLAPTLAEVMREAWKISFGDLPPLLDDVRQRDASETSVPF